MPQLFHVYPHHTISPQATLIYCIAYDLFLTLLTLSSSPLNAISTLELGPKCLLRARRIVYDWVFHLAHQRFVANYEAYQKGPTEPHAAPTCSCMTGKLPF